ncbi:MAG: multidrug efflux SMR transporter [Myxococcota bacterium]
MTPYISLAVAICAEVVATSFLKASDGFTKLSPSLVVIVGYVISFYSLSLALRTIPLGIAYALWAGLGIVLIAVISAVIYRQPPDLPAALGIALIVSGVVVIQLLSKTTGH